MKPLSQPVNEPQERLQPLMEELSRKLDTEQLRQYSMPYLSGVLCLLDSIQAVLSSLKFPVFLKVIDLLNQFMGDILVEKMSYYSGMSYVLNLYELFEEAWYSLITGQEKFPELEQNLLRLRSMFNRVDVEGIIQSTANEEATIQVLREDLRKDTVLSDFVSESLEGLDAVEATLLRLENNPDQLELIQPVFRMIHTIKGTSGFLELTIIGTLAHHLEDLLGQLRDRTRVFTLQVFEACLHSVDVLKQLIQQVSDLIYEEPPVPVNVKAAYKLLSLCLVAEKKVPSFIPEFDSNASAYIKPLGAILIEKGMVSQEAVNEALEEQNRPLGEILVQKGIVSREGMNAALTEQSTLPKSSGKEEMVRVSSAKLDELAELMGEMVVALSLLSQNTEIAAVTSRRTQTNRKARERLEQLEKVTEHLRDRILGMRMFPVGSIFNKLSRQVRDLAHKSGKHVNLYFEGEDTLVDKTIIDSMYSPLMHLVRNAIDHGLESAEERQEQGKPTEGNLYLRARHQGDSVILEIVDDGRGLQRELILAKAIKQGLLRQGETLTDQQVFAFIFQAGFSTASQVTDVSGRGVGMDVVRHEVEKLRGKITIESAPHQGTTFTIQLPLTTSIIEGLVVRVGDTRFVIPMLDAKLTHIPKPEDLKRIQGAEQDLFLLAGDLVPIIRLHQFYALENAVTDPAKAVMIVVQVENKKYGLMTDELLQRQQVVVKNLGDRFAHLKGIAGGTILGDGRIGLILNPREVITCHQ
ncbi:chemotaxis protein CheA [Deltaproteobacteria bacterium TL4]